MNHHTAKYVGLNHYILTTFYLTRHGDFIYIKPLYPANYKIKKCTEFSSGFLNPLDVQSIVKKTPSSYFLMPFLYSNKTRNFRYISCHPCILLYQYHKDPVLVTWGYFGSPTVRSGNFSEPNTSAYTGIVSLSLFSLLPLQLSALSV